MRKKYLQDKIARLSQKIKDLKTRAAASQDVNEVRSIHEKIEEMNADVADAQAELDAITADEQAAQQRSAQTPPAGAAYVNGGKRDISICKCPFFSFPTCKANGFVLYCNQATIFTNRRVTLCENDATESTRFF